MSCCNLGTSERELDAIAGLGSAEGFLERSGIREASRYPLPRISPADFLVHRLPVDASAVVPELQRHLHGPTPSDRGRTAPWPYPGQSED